MSLAWYRQASEAIKRARGVLGMLFPEQYQVVMHPARWKAVLTPRRAGKTLMACAWLLHVALLHAGCKVLFVALTRPSAQDIAWGLLKRIDAEYSLGCHFQDSKLECQLPNGSIVMLRGADQANWVARLEGQEFRLIIVDESGLFSLNLWKLIYGSFRPMVIKGHGTICLIGRPGDIKHGLFYELTGEDKRIGDKVDGAWTVEDKQEGVDWSVFWWSTLQNPHLASEWKEEIESRLARNPQLINDAKFQRHYLGRWCEDAEGNVYGGFSDERNVVAASAWQQQEGDQFGLGVDFGWDDAQGFSVLAWSPRRPECWVLESYKEKHMPLAQALDRIASYQGKYPNLRIWGDPARKQLYQEMAGRFGAAVAVAEKQEKAAHIDLLNNDFALGRIKVVRETNAQYLDELRNLKRLVKENGEWVEHPRQPNDLCDCTLYVWRHAQHFRYRDPLKLPPPGSPAAMEREVEDHWRKAAEKQARKDKAAWWRRS